MALQLGEFSSFFFGCVGRSEDQSEVSRGGREGGGLVVRGAVSEVVYLWYDDERVL